MERTESAQFLFDKLEQVLEGFDQLLLQVLDTQLDFRPTPTQMQLRELGVHVYQTVLLMTSAIQNGRYAEYDLELIPFYIHKVRAATDIVEYGKYVKAYLHDLRQHLTETSLNRAIPPRGNFTGLDALWLMLQESVHHHGQLTVYLRLLGHR